LTTSASSQPSPRQLVNLRHIIIIIIIIITSHPVSAACMTDAATHDHIYMRNNIP